MGGRRLSPRPRWRRAIQYVCPPPHSHGDGSTHCPARSNYPKPQALHPGGRCPFGPPSKARPRGPLGASRRADLGGSKPFLGGLGQNLASWPCLGPSLALPGPPARTWPKLPFFGRFAPVPALPPGRCYPGLAWACLTALFACEP